MPAAITKRRANKEETVFIILRNFAFVVVATPKARQASKAKQIPPSRLLSSNGPRVADKWMLNANHLEGSSAIVKKNYGRFFSPKGRVTKMTILRFIFGIR